MHSVEGGEMPIFEVTIFVFLGVTFIHYTLKYNGQIPQVLVKSKQGKLFKNFTSGACMDKDQWIEWFSSSLAGGNISEAEVLFNDIVTNGILTRVKGLRD